MARAKEIRDLRIDEVSLVDKGANQHARTVIAKRHDVEEETTVENYFNEDGDLIDLEALEPGDHVWDENGQEYEFDDSDDDEYTYEDELLYDDDLVEKGFLSGGEKLFGRASRKLANAKSARTLKGERRAPVAAIQAGGKARHDFSARGSASAFGGDTAFNRASNKVWGSGASAGRRKKYAAAGIGGTALAGGGAVGYHEYKKSYADEVREELSKALTDQDRDDVISKALGQVEYFAEIAKAAEEAAESERELRLEREYTEIAKSYNVPVHPSDLGRVLKRIAEILPLEDQEVIKRCLDATAASEELFEEYGFQGGGDNSDILSQVDALVDGSVIKGNYSREDVISKVFEENPDAYDEYLAEQRGR